MTAETQTLTQGPTQVPTQVDTQTDVPITARLDMRTDPRLDPRTVAQTNPVTPLQQTRGSVPANPAPVAHTRKVEINLGYACNAECPFCYYYDSVVTRTNEQTQSTEDAKAQLRHARQLGIQEIEFTGGEVTMRRDLPELITYAKQELGFSIVSMITNGIRLANPAYTAELRSAGIDDMLFSIHGHNAQIHDGITRVGKSFDRIVRAIRNASALGIRVRTNTVICKPNYLHTREMLEFLLTLSIDNINLVMFNPVLQAKNIDITEEVYVNYADAGREITKALDVLVDRLPQFNVRYMPFCFLPGYERFITNMDQMTFDPDEWDNFASFRIRHGGVKSWLTLIPGIFNTPYVRQLIRHGFAALCTAAQSRFYVLKDRVKTASCKRCAYQDVCDYVYRDYLNVYGDSEITAIAGPRIKDPAWAMEAARFRRPGELPEPFKARATIIQSRDRLIASSVA